MKKIYNFEPDRVKEFLKKEEIEKVAIQLPSGLRPYLNEIKPIFEEENVKVLFLSISCYGACDIADKKAQSLNCDALIHYGHADMGIPTSIPVLYVEARMEIEPFEALKKALPKLEGSKWGLVTTVQHIDHLEKVKEFLDKNEIKSVIGKPGPRSKYPGHISGCDWGSAKSVSEEVDGFLYIGTGSFHPVGVALSTGKPVISVNPVSEESERIDPELDKFFRKRAAILEKAKSKENFGVVVSTKQGQNRLNLAEKLTEKLEKAGYDAYLLVSDEISPEILEDFQLDAFVNTACPRIALDDSELYDKPMLTPFEVNVLLGEQDWEPYQLDEIGINFEAR